MASSPGRGGHQPHRPFPGGASSCPEVQRRTDVASRYRRRRACSANRARRRRLSPAGPCPRCWPRSRGASRSSLVLPAASATAWRIAGVVTPRDGGASGCPPEGRSGSDSGRDGRGLVASVLPPARRTGGRGGVPLGRGDVHAGRQGVRPGEDGIGPVSAERAAAGMTLARGGGRGGRVPGECAPGGRSCRGAEGRRGRPLAAPDVPLGGVLAGRCARLPGLPGDAYLPMPGP